MSKPGSTEQITALKDLLSTELPDGLTVLAPVYFDYGTYTHFGRGTFVNHNCYFMDGGTIHIGENVFIIARTSSFIPRTVIKFNEPLFSVFTTSNACKA